MAFRALPVGTGWEGAPAYDPHRREDEVRRPVRVTTRVYFQTTEVSNRAYREFDSSHESGMFESARVATDRSADDPTLPVVRVSHSDAVRFCAWLSERDPRFRYRLPTESEWEWACRAGQWRRTARGLTTDQANWNGIGLMEDSREGPALDRTAPVGSYPPNAWGLHDLHGNVWEWCADVYEPDGAHTPPASADNRETPLEYVLRGGSWNSNAWSLRCSHRWHEPPTTRDDTIGFRVVAVAKTRTGPWPRSDHAGPRVRPGWEPARVTRGERLARSELIARAARIRSSARELTLPRAVAELELRRSHGLGGTFHLAQWIFDEARGADLRTQALQWMIDSRHPAAVDAVLHALEAESDERASSALDPAADLLCAIGSRPTFRCGGQSAEQAVLFAANQLRARRVAVRQWVAERTSPGRAHGAAPDVDGSIASHPSPLPGGARYAARRAELKRSLDSRGLDWCRQEFLRRRDSGVGGATPLLGWLIDRLAGEGHAEFLLVAAQYAVDPDMLYELDRALASHDERLRSGALHVMRYLAKQGIAADLLTPRPDDPETPADARHLIRRHWAQLRLTIVRTD